MRPARGTWWWCYILVPVLVGAVTIAPAAFGPGLPIENNDETAHTFIDLPAFQRALRSGTLLEINLGANFGSPLLGDPVVCPLAPHAITYALLAPAPAMVVNKFVLATLSTLALTAFFAAYAPLGIASLCAVLAFSSPAFLYFFHHHPHQGALLYFTALLLALRRFLREPDRWRAILLFAAAIACALGVGAHGAMLAAAFALAFLALTPAASRRARVVAIALCGLAATALLPHWLEFARLAMASARRGINYQALFVTPPTALIKELLIARAASEETRDIVHYSPALVALIVAGAVMVRRSAIRHLVWGLGLAPLVLVLACRIEPALIAAIPIVRSINVTRTLWFSDIFLLVGAAAAAAAMVALPVFRSRVWLGYVILIAALAPRAHVAWWQLDAFHATPEDLAFQPREFLGLLAPGTRLATDIDPVPDNFDTRAIPYGVLASTGRSILLNHQFRERLAAAGLILPGWNGLTYAFAPVAPDRLAPYGVRYFATRSHGAELQAAGWRQVGREQGVDLFVAPAAVTPVYVDGGELQFIETYRLNGNTVEVALPPGGRRTIVAAFADIGGWRAELDGAPLALTSRRGLIAADVTGGAQLRFVYAPYSAAAIVLVALFALAAAAGLIARVI